ncbi:hypothetical protein [Nonomuraea lactucae]|uniref:hypothetical protein n=1 Tax=Nonomuraea lactucae TaxID=2249762 RepID=UPI000DE23DD3|nr:hypothetical protein [Nonomuraea lactucae]
MPRPCRVHAAARTAAEQRHTTYQATDSTITIGIAGPDARHRIDQLRTALAMLAMLAIKTDGPSEMPHANPPHPAELAFADQIDAGSRGAAFHNLITATVRQMLDSVTGGGAPGSSDAVTDAHGPKSGKVTIFGGRESPESSKADL